MKNTRRSALAAIAALIAVASLLTLPSSVQAKDEETPKAVAAAPIDQQTIAMADGTKIVLPDGTHVKLQLTETLTSNNSKTGEEVHYVVDEDVTDSEKRVLIRKGAPASGVVTLAKGRGGLGKSGKLQFTCESVTAVDGSKIRLRGEEAANGKGGKGSMLAVTLLVSPLGLFMKGHNITVKQGTIITAYVNSSPSPVVESKLATKPAN